MSKKKYGVVGVGNSISFFNVPFKHGLFKCLKEAAIFIKDNTDKPATIKNRLNEIITAFDNVPIWGLFFQMLILQGLCRWLECVNINEGDNGYNEAQSLYNWLCEILADKELRFCFVPYGDKDKEQLKPLCDYLLSTEVGKLVQQLIRKEYYSEPQQEPNKGVMAAFTLPAELDTTEAKKGTAEPKQKGRKAKPLIDYFLKDTKQDDCNRRQFGISLIFKTVQAALISLCAQAVHWVCFQRSSMLSVRHRCS